MYIFSLHVFVQVRSMSGKSIITACFCVLIILYFIADRFFVVHRLFHSFIHLFAFINYSTKLQLIIIHLAGSPGSYFAYLKDCLKKRSKKLECKLSVAEQKY